MSVFFWKPRKKWVAQWMDDGKKKRRYFNTEKEASDFENDRVAPEEE